MEQQKALFEQVNYRLSDIEHTMLQFLFNYVKYSDIKGVNQWFCDVGTLSKIIREQQQRSFKLKAQGLIVSFSGFASNATSESDGHILTTAEPQIHIAQDTKVALTLSRSQYLQEFTQANMREMEEVYKLDPNYKNNTLVFPKNYYASTQLFPVVLL